MWHEILLWLDTKWSLTTRSIKILNLDHNGLEWRSIFGSTDLCVSFASALCCSPVQHHSGKWLQICSKSGLPLSIDKEDPHIVQILGIGKNYSKALSLRYKASRLCSFEFRCHVDYHKKIEFANFFCRFYEDLVQILSYSAVLHEVGMWSSFKMRYILRICI